MSEQNSIAVGIAGDTIVDRVNAALDGTVEFVNRRFTGKYHPYFLMEDIAGLSFVALGFGFELAFGHLAGWSHALAISIVFALYTLVYLRVKRWVTGVAARSFMQDSMLFVLPAYLSLSWLMGQDMAAAIDVLALSLLLAVGLMRIGCFFGGCCHGLPSRIGVLYRTQVLRAMDGVRLFVPGDDLGVRVFPIQLACSLYVFIVFAVLWTRLGTLARPDGSTLALAVIAYSSLRVVLEFFRGHRHRPTYFGFSEAQWLSLALILAATGELLLA
ncbi:prolipoprotein diacylglyceryl transferase family protein [Xanthobacter sediminis]